MSRSVKHTPIRGLLKGSDKQGKVRSHRKERSLIKKTLSTGEEPIFSKYSFGDEWDWQKDGKIWVAVDELTASDLRNLICK